MILDRMILDTTIAAGMVHVGMALAGKDLAVMVHSGMDLVVILHAVKVHADTM